MINTIDHLIIAVSDIQLAEKDYETLLGRYASWSGKHVELGTQNVIFRLLNTYIELVAVDVTSSAGSDFSNLIKHKINSSGDGLIGFALGSTNIHDDRERLISSGLSMPEASRGSACNAVDGKTRGWEMCLIPPEHSRGFLCFLIQHDDVLEIPFSKRIEDEGQNQLGQIDSLDHMVISTANADEFISAFHTGLGLALKLDKTNEAWGVRQLFFRIGDNILEVVEPLDSKKKPEQDYYWGLAYGTANIQATHQRLKQSASDTSEVRKGRKPKTMVATAKGNNLNISTLIIGPELLG